MFGICNLSIVPCRKEPSDKSEMITQLLFGEHFEVLDEKKSWVLIRIAYDGYECWIDKKQFSPISEKNIKSISNTNTAVTTDLVQLAIPLSSPNEREKFISVVLGSSLPYFQNKIFSLAKQEFIFEGAVKFPFQKKKKNENKVLSSDGNDLRLNGIADTARWYLNTPYLWGGRSPFGIDCSGFTQMVFKLNGIKLFRDVWQQARYGTTLSFLEEAQTGDLAFFDNKEGDFIHVGILLGNNKIIHASGKVHIDPLDHHGIFNEEMKKYTHSLRVVKRYLSF
ncbi:MAG: C40 family peptidase [Bacteroidota bacterium]